MIGAPFTVADAMFGDGDGSRAVADGLTLLGLLLGVPTGQLAKTAGYLTDIAEGDARPRNPMDVAQGLVSGRDVTRN